MILEILDYDFSICKVSDINEVDLTNKFYFVSKTNEEISIVCPSNIKPKSILNEENGYKAFRIKGALDFSLIGILSKISSLLAENNIGIFVISTYNTDYIFVKKNNFNKAINILKNNGYKI